MVFYISGYDDQTEDKRDMFEEQDMLLKNKQTKMTRFKKKKDPTPY